MVGIFLELIIMPWISPSFISRIVVTPVVIYGSTLVLNDRTPILHGELQHTYHQHIHKEVRFPWSR